MFFQISQSPDAENRIRQYNVVSSLLAMDDLIRKVETALARELSSEYLDLSKSESCLKVGNIKSSIHNFRFFDYNPFSFLQYILE